MVVDRSAAQDAHGLDDVEDEYEVNIDRKMGGHDHEDEDEEMEVQGAFDRSAGELEYIPSEKGIFLAESMVNLIYGSHQVVSLTMLRSLRCPMRKKGRKPLAVVRWSPLPPSG